MKNFVIKTFLIVFSCLLFLAWFSYAEVINFTEVSYSNSCSQYTGETKYFNYYLSNNTYTQNPYDTFTATSHDAIQLASETSVWLWRGAWFVSGCNDWRSSSTIAKVGVPWALVLFNNNWCTFKKPSNTYIKTSSTSIDAQIQFTIWYVSKWVSNQLTLPAWQKLYYKLPNDDLRTCYENGDQVSNFNQCPNSPSYPVSYIIHHTWECINYRIFWCGDWLLNGYNWSTSYDNWTSAEECDPALPSSIPNWYTCNASCQLVQNVQQPQCNSAYSWTHYVNNPAYPNWLTQNMNLCTVWTVTNFTNRWNWYGHLWHYGWTCSNSAGSVSCQANQQWCWDWIKNGSEACDPNDSTHSGWNGMQCSNSCQPITEQPQCNSAYSWTHYVNNPAYPNWLTQNMNLCTVWTVTNFTNRWNWYGHLWHYGWTCSNSAGSVSCQANQQWCWDWIKNGSEACDPNDSTHSGWNGMQCSNSCQLYNPGHPQLTIEKEQISTWSMAPWSLVTYKITVRNIWSWTATGVSIYDALPRELQYMTSSISIVPNSTYQFTTGTVQIWGYSRTYIRYFNITLNANWTATVYLTWKVKDWFTFDTLTNCATVSWSNIQPHEDCVTTTPPTPQLPNLTIEKEQISTWNMTAWSLVTYKITVRNIWSWTATGVSIYDALPRELQYMTSSIAIVPNSTYQFTTGIVQIWGYSRTYIRYFNITLNANWTATVYLTWKVKDWFTFDTLTNCATVSWSNIQPHEDCVITTPPTPQLPHLTILKELLSAWDMTAWSTVVYKITLTNDWNATYHNAYILDILPNAIQYQTSSIQNITNYLFEEWTTWNNDYFIRYYNFNLNAGQSAIVYLTWILREWFNFNQTTNCAFTSGDDSCVLFPLTPIPYVKKWQKVWNMDYTDEIIQVQLWDTIRYKVDFANLWNSAATGQVKDVLPPCVKYVSSSIHWVNPYQWPIVGQQWVQDVVLYKNFPLAAWQTWYMLVEAEIKESWILWVNCSDTRSYLNTWYFKFTTDVTRLSDDVLAIREESAGSEVIFDKTWNKKLMHPGEGELEFTITVTNKWPNSISNIYVDDIRPHEDCIIYEWRTGDESLIEYIDPLRWHYIWLQEVKTNYNIPWEPNSTHIKGTLYAWQSFSFIIFASVKDDPACVGYYINTWRLTYTEWGEQHTLYDDYDFEVIDDNSEYACESLVSSGSIVELGTNNQWNMRFTCTASDSKPHTIYIDCGNGRWDTWYNSPSFTYNCIYWEADEGSSLVATCLVDGEEPTNPACIKKIWINPGLYWNCGNGTIEAWEDCDLWGSEWQSIIITDFLDAAKTIRAWQFEWNYCKNCKMITGNNFVYEPAECLHSDTPISVMENETMPFWWRLRIKNDQRLVWKNGCYQDSAYATSEKTSSYNTNSSPSPRDKDTILWKDEMYCRFSVYNWSNKLQWNNWNSAISFKLPCFEGENSFNTLPIYQYFINHHMTKADWASFATVHALMWWSKNYWEYKLVLEKVEYQYCDTSVGKWKPWKRYGAICEVDFAVTKPYMMQVSTFGVNPVATNGEKFLDDYYDMDWKKILDSTDLKETINTDNTNYAVSSDAKSQMNTFKEKYEKLAVAVKTSTISSLWLNTNWVTSVSKVPNQSIYFIKWNWWTLKLSQKKWSTKTAAYTLIVEWMDVEIQWDMFVYAMIVADHIKFTDAWGSKGARCAEWWQVVQWIFVALKWFEQWSSLVNTNENTERCARWGLHVKWVLIWNNINNLMNGRRSQLNSRFNVDTVSSSKSKVRTERKKKIMEGAALLIEYNPSLWKTLPPWADIFTESLEVYKK